MPGPSLRLEPAAPRAERAGLDDAVAWISAAARPIGGNRHSRRVALLKRILPAIGVALLLLIAAWPRLSPLWDRMRTAFPAIDLREARQLRMLNPRYAGTDRLGRPFLVTAAVGRQVSDRQDLMSLEQPRADLKTHSGADIVVTAATGAYQSQTQILDLFGGVTLAREDGTKFVTAAARVDVANNAAEGGDPVEGHGPSGEVKAAGFQIRDRGDTILFTGNADMLLRGAKPGTEKAAPPSLPAPVAAAAARITRATPPAAAKRPAAAKKPVAVRAANAKPAAAKKPAPRK